MIVMRLLIYEGNEEVIEKTLSKNSVKDIQRVTGMTITEYYDKEYLRYFFKGQYRKLKKLCKEQLTRRQDEPAD